MPLHATHHAHMSTCDGCGRARDDPDLPPLVERATEALIEIVRTRVRHTNIPEGYRFTFTLPRPLADRDVEQISASLSELQLRVRGVHTKDGNPCTVSVNAERAPPIILPGGKQSEHRSIERCPRCAGAHTATPWFPLQLSTRSIFTHWAICPTTSDPVLATLTAVGIEEIA